MLREEILTAATELLEDGGDERTVTLRAVARRAGITAPSIYPHFPGTVAIMLALAEQGFVELNAGIRSAIDTAGADPRHRLNAACRAYVGFADSHPERYRAMFDASDDPIGLADRTLGLLTTALAECVAAGRSTSTNPAADAALLWVGLHGLAHQRAVTTSYPWPTDIVARVTAPLSHLVVT
ncbi:TetR/AcrR family transcriptional regulator [Pseudonocardia spinosispora]|uniref:TetR/AcrR family transcriptional regulator n=1 Tax=Pseudonocardia spinosispora TaxID=103441 RepID=UPI000420EDE3|nr:TetR/AcrR family transcriptional regulator [Pseudonocardia spinosispora]